MDAARQLLGLRPRGYAAVGTAVELPPRCVQGGGRRGSDDGGDDGGGGDGGGGGHEARLRVGGMSCAACSSSVEAALAAVPGVSRAAVALLSGTAVVAYDPRRVSPPDLLAAVDDAGFDATLEWSGSKAGPSGGGGQPEEPEALRMRIGGMSCGACAAGLEAALARLKGVASASVSYATGALARSIACLLSLACLLAGPLAPRPAAAAGARAPPPTRTCRPPPLSRSHGRGAVRARRLRAARHPGGGGGRRV